MRLLDLGFYSPVITGSRCNVRLSAARPVFPHANRKDQEGGEEEEEEGDQKKKKEGD